MLRHCGLLRRILKISQTQVRTLVKKFPKREGGIQYYGFTYYPRYPGEKDPPYEPSKLFLVTRLCSMRGLNPVERHTLELLNINGEKKFKDHVAIVKNIPEINAMLWRVKHLVSIKPIRCVNGMPENGDFTGTYLRDNGEFLVNKRVEPERIEAFEKFQNDPKHFTTMYMRNYLRLKWDDGFDGDM